MHTVHILHTSMPQDYVPATRNPQPGTVVLVSSAGRLLVCHSTPHTTIEKHQIEKNKNMKCVLCLFTFDLGQNLS